MTLVCSICGKRFNVAASLRTRNPPARPADRLQCGRVAEDAESNLTQLKKAGLIVLQCGRVAEDAESAWARRACSGGRACFNVAASLRTRNQAVAAHWKREKKMLQCGRVAEDAESQSLGRLTSGPESASMWPRR